MISWEQVERIDTFFDHGPLQYSRLKLLFFVAPQQELFPTLSVVHNVSPGELIKISVKQYLAMIFSPRFPRSRGYLCVSVEAVVK